MFYIYVELLIVYKKWNVCYSPYECRAGLFVEGRVRLHRDDALLAAGLQHGALEQTYTFINTSEY